LVKYAPVILRLMRKCPGAFRIGEQKVWCVPSRSAVQLSEAMYAIEQRSR
jgi:hypothetical protein